MEIGVALPLPQDAFGSDVGVLRDYATATEDLGFAHLTAFDHLVGTDPDQVPHIPVRYTQESVWHEPLVTLGWVAAMTQRLRLITGVLVAPLRSPVLLAQQVAQLDVLSEGRVTLGVGVGANPIEYQAAGVDFTCRGDVLDEQLELLTSLWTEPTVTATFTGGELVASGLNPLPVQRPVPIHVGGRSGRALRRAASRAQGHLLMTLDPDPAGTVRRLSRLLEEHGRPVDGFDFHGFLDTVTGTPDDWRVRAEAARTAGITRVSVLTAHPSLGVVGAGANLVDHLTRVADALTGMLDG